MERSLSDLSDSPLTIKFVHNPLLTFGSHLFYIEFNAVPILYKWIATSYIIILRDVGFYVVNLVLLALLFSNIIIVQRQFMLARAQQNRSNSTADDVESTRNRIIPQAQEVNESNLELI